MFRSLSLTLAFLFSISISVISQSYIPYNSYVTSNGIHGQPNLRHQYIDNLLYVATSRYAVTLDAPVTATLAGLFNGHYDTPQPFILEAGQTGKITIEFGTKGSSNITYPGGKVYLHFYYTSIPLSVSGRVQRTDDTWFDISDWINISSSSISAIWQGTVTNAWTGMKKMEVTINARTTGPASLIEFEYVPDRRSIESGVVTKFAPNTLYRNLYWRNTDNTLVAQISETGDAYFKGNVGVNLTNPTANLHVTGTTIITGNTKVGSLSISTGAGLGKVLTSDASGNATWQTPSASGPGNSWGFGGSPVPAEQTIGTTSNYDLPFISNNLERMRISKNGSIGIGTTNIGTDYKLYVEGNIRTRKVRVDQSSWPDYVFHPTYQLMPLNELQQFIHKNQHLPGVPAAQEVSRTGIDLGDNQAILLKKIEELTLYILEQNKRIEELERTVKSCK
ncbi:hypothetical protein [Pseudobacter ginsenosidimutans]|uniref:Endosialidase-like protein n=1 Tax=Pseudobacter ginsenosidimutans TaxID=661488 RepID=A0A4Q7MFT5_9BACT|nr:hypothetical protein [Pseudobacter ginsenosidimutans]QEC45332.1 hypothetical protein FSB84_27905 [Pseudobacter ginsenosidimutans]RZS65602.1 hypothetical protein EV199_5777 [Pseudobacter ginsenosidimutans]